MGVGVEIPLIWKDGKLAMPVINWNTYEVDSTTGNIVSQQMSEATDLTVSMSAATSLPSAVMTVYNKSAGIAAVARRAAESSLPSSYLGLNTKSPALQAIYDAVDSTKTRRNFTLTVSADATTASLTVCRDLTLLEDAAESGEACKVAFVPTESGGRALLLSAVNRGEMSTAQRLVVDCEQTYVFVRFDPNTSDALTNIVASGTTTNNAVQAVTYTTDNIEQYTLGAPFRAEGYISKLTPSGDGGGTIEVTLFSTSSKASIPFSLSFDGPSSSSTVAAPVAAADSSGVVEEAEEESELSPSSCTSSSSIITNEEDEAATVVATPPIPTTINVVTSSPPCEMQFTQPLDTRHASVVSAPNELEVLGLGFCIGRSITFDDLNGVPYLQSTSAAAAAAAAAASATTSSADDDAEAAAIMYDDTGLPVPLGVKIETATPAMDTTQAQAIAEATVARTRCNAAPNETLCGETSGCAWIKDTSSIDDGAGVCELDYMPLKVVVAGLVVLVPGVHYACTRWLPSSIDATMWSRYAPGMRTTYLCSAGVGAIAVLALLALLRFRARYAPYRLQFVQPLRVLLAGLLLSPIVLGLCRRFDRSVCWLIPVTLLTMIGALMTVHKSLNVVNAQSYVVMASSYLIIWHFIIVECILWWILYMF